LDRIRLRLDRPKLRKAERSQRQTGERCDPRADRRRIGIVSSYSFDRADQYAAGVRNPIVQLPSLPDEGQQRSPHRTKVATVFSSQLLETAGIYMEMVYRYLNLG
jgi:hypothetical protein